MNRIPTKLEHHPLIVRGLALDDIDTIRAGAIPAALMALAVQGVFELIDRVVIPKGLQL